MSFSGPIPEQQPAPSLASILVFAGIGFSQAFRINIGGQLTVFEILSMGGALLAAFNPPRQGWLPAEKVFFKGLFAWLLIQMLTDAARSIPLTDMAKGIARITTFGTAYVCLSCYVMRDLSRLGGLLFGLGLSYIASFYLYTAVDEVAEPWKWCWGPALTFSLIGAMLALRWSKAMVWRLCLLGLAALHLAFNFRSFGAICFVAGATPWVWPLVRPVPVWVRMAVSILGFMLMAFAYGQLASSGTLGQAAKMKYEMQAKQDSGPFSFILGGRPEYRAASKAIAQSPLLGYGSWAKHPDFVYELHDPERGEFDARRFASALDLGIIPSHSHLLGAWVDGGILPALGWGALWIYAFLLLNRVDWSKMAPDPLVLLLGGGLLWAILFSPFGSGNRLTTALSFCVLIHRAAMELRIRMAPGGPVDSVAKRKLSKLRSALPNQSLSR